MAFQETLSDIQDEVFGEYAPVYTLRYSRARVPSDGNELGTMLRPGGGFHVIRGACRQTGAVETPYRVAYKRRHDATTQKGRIRAALLAGESPRGFTTPVRWLAVAKELGIDLMARSDPKFSQHWNKDGKR